MEDINLTEIIIQTISEILNGLFSSIDNTLYSFLDDIVFINSDILNDNYFEQILGTSSSNGILLIANSLLIGFVIYYASKILLVNFITIEVQRPYQFIFKIIFFGICMNFSFFICEQIISINSAISLSIRQIGEYLFKRNICFSEIIREINSFIIIEGNSNIISFNGILKSFISIGLLNLVFSYSLRYVMIKVFILISPFAIISLSNISTSWFFKAWLKCFLSLLFIQILISLILLLIFSFNFSGSDIFSKLMYIGGIYALIKANSFIRDFMGGITTTISYNISNLKFR